MSYFQRAARAAARRRGEEVWSDGIRWEDDDDDAVVAADVDIQGFYTLDSSLGACARVPLSGDSGGRSGRGEGSAGREGQRRGVEGVRKSEFVGHVAEVGKRMLLDDRVFADALVPS